jgi:RHS repeat-associated protein
MMAGDFQNRVLAEDVDNNGFIAIADLQPLVSHLRIYGVAHDLTQPITPPIAAPPYVDVTGDDVAAINDLLAIVTPLREGAGFPAPVIEASLANDTGAAGDNVTADPTLRGRVAANFQNGTHLVGRMDDDAFFPISLGAGGDFSFTPALALDGTANGPHVVQFLGQTYGGAVSTATFSFTLESGMSALQLTEGNQFLVQADHLIDVGQAQGARRLRVQIDADFDTTDQTAVVEDTLLVSLVNPNDATQTLLDRGDNGTTLFTLAGGQADFPPGLVRYDGSVLEIDLTSITTSGQGRLLFQLLNLDGDTGGQAMIRVLSNEVDPQGAAAPMFDRDESPVTAGGAMDLTGLIASDSLDAVWENVRFDSSANHYLAELSIRNDGPPVGRRAAVVFPGLPSGVTLLNPSGRTTGGDPYVNVSPAVPHGGLDQGQSSAPVLVELANPELARFTLRAQVLAGPNQPPQFTPVGALQITPGATLHEQLAATDPDGDRITFSLAADGKLPTGMLSGSGVLTFLPKPEQLGEYTFTLSASDGALETTQEVTLTVQADPVTTTRISGVVLNVDQTPLVGMQVEIGAVQGLTQSDGSFTLDLGAGPLVSDTLKVRGELFPGPLVYPFIAEKLPLVLEHDVFAGVNNVIDRPIFLPPLDVANGKQIDPMQDTMVTTAAIPGAAVFVAAGTLMNQQGTPFDGILSITEVPPDLTPAALPENLKPSLVVTIQPGEMVFATPAPLALPNSEGWAAGTTMDLWSINPVTGQFDLVGTGLVSADGGVVQTVSGGIRNSSWHFFVPPSGTLRSLLAEALNQDLGCSECSARRPLNSTVEYHSGHLQESHRLATYDSLGQTRGLSLVYDSQRADPQYIVHFGFDDVSSFPGTLEPRVIARLTVEAGEFLLQTPGYTGEEYGLSGGEHFWRVRNGDIDAALMADLTDLPSGRYPYELDAGLYSLNPTNQRFGGSSARSQGALLHVNAVQGPFGSGWGLAGLMQLVESNDGSVLWIDGNGSELLFAPPSSVGASYVSPPGDFSTLEKLQDGTFRRTVKDRTVYTFDAQNRLSAMTDRNGNATRYEYDHDGLLSKITDPVGLETAFTATNGRITAITDPAGRVTQLRYDAAGNLLRVIDPDNSQRTWTYDRRHHMTGETDQRGQKEKTLWDEFGRVAQGVAKDGTITRVSPAQVRGLYSSAATSDPFTAPRVALTSDAQASAADANGNVSRFQLDQRGQVVASADGAGRAMRYDRNGQNLVSHTTDGRGFETIYAYDERGNLVRRLDSLSFDDARAARPGRMFDASSSFANRPSDMASGDVNGDGDLDLVVAHAMAGVSILFGRGDGTFEAPVEYPLAMDFRYSTEALVLGDADGDGDLDVLVLNEDSYGAETAVVLFTNDGDGVFAAQSFEKGSPIEFFDAGDVDGDGDFDLVVGHTQLSTMSILLRGPEGITAQAPVEVGDHPQAAHLADVNHDQHLDLIVGNFAFQPNPNTFSVLLGNGIGTFGPRSVLELPVSPVSITSADLNGDGNLDLIAAGSQVGNDPHVMRIWFGSGNGQFHSPLDLDSPDGARLTKVVAIDLDFDRDLDLVAASAGTSAAVAYYNNGLGEFGPPRMTPRGYENYRATIAVGDFNRDAALDLASGSATSQVILNLGDGVGSFRSYAAVEVGDYLTPTFYADGLAAADLDRDGDPDLVSIIKSTIAVSLNNGNGTFAPREDHDIYELNLRENLHVADMNGDGRLDVISVGYQLNVLLGDGFGGFGDPLASEGVYSTSFNASDVGDVDGDGDLDVVFAIQSTFNPGTYLFRNNGNGTFAAAETIANAEMGVAGARLADMNRDGILDLVTSVADFANNMYSVAVQTGNGQGGFGPPARFPLSGPSLSQLAIGDLNGDNYPDVLASQEGLSGNQAVVFLNDGQSGLGARRELPLHGVPRSTALADVNGDGLPDLLVGLGPATWAGAVEVFYGDGTGSFPSRDSFTAAGPTGEVAVSDMDRDGTPDIIAAGNEISIIFGSGGGRIGGPQLYAYDTVFNQMTSETDELGRRTLYEIDPANGNVLSETRVVGELGGSDDVVTRYTYTPRGQVATTTDPNGHVTRNSYDSVGRLIELTEALGTPEEASRQYEYNVAGNLTAAIDENGNRTEYAYDAMNRLTRLTEADPDAAGMLAAPVTTFTYDAAGNQLTETDARGNVMRWDYDAMGRMSRQIDAAQGVMTFDYDPAGNIVARTDELGRTTRYAYDARNRRVETIDPNGGRTRWRYNLNNDVISVTDQNGRTTTYGYDARHRLTRESDPLGHSTLYAYDPADQLRTVTDPNGHTTRFNYDELSRRVSVIDPLGGLTSYDYDLAGNLLAEADELNRRTQYAYDARDRLVSLTDPLGHATTFRYDAAGNLTSTTDELERQTRLEYDALHRQVKTTDALAGVKTSVFDAVDNLTSVTDELNRKTQFEYDALDRVVSITDPLDHVSRLTYDAVGNVLSKSDALGQTTRFTYDKLDRLTSSADPRGATSRYAFDPVGNLLSLTDPVGNKSEWQYDALDRAVRETNALGASRVYGYDAVGNLIATTDRNGRARQFAYDALDRRTEERWLDGAGNPLRTFEFAYDAASQLLTATDPDSAYAYSYDAAGRTVGSTNAGTPGAPTVAFTFDYDAVNNLLARSDTIDGAASGMNAHQYDALNRPTRITQSGAGVMEKHVEFAYDAASQMTGVSRFADLGGSQIVAASDYDYDLGGRLTGLTHARNPTTIAQYSWVFDDANRITRATSPDGTSNYSYDTADQLLGADHAFQTDETFSYDGSGNRTNAGYQTITDNRLRSDGEFNYEYDAEGNRVRQTSIATGETTEYEWDHRNRLIRVVDKSAAGAIAQDIRYSYDAFDRRLAKSIDADGAGPAAATQRFVYDGDHIALQFDGAGTQTHRYLHGARVDQILADETADEVLWPLADFEGTVRDLVDSAGAIVDHIRYESFGSITSDTNAAVDHLFAFTGRELDPETGLYYVRSRYYDSHAGRFLSEDPRRARFEQPLTSNEYQYARNSPLMLVDRFGEAEEPPLTNVSPPAVTQVSARNTQGFTAEQIAYINHDPLSPAEKQSLWRGMVENTEKLPALSRTELIQRLDNMAPSQRLNYLRNMADEINSKLAGEPQQLGRYHQWTTQELLDQRNVLRNLSSEIRNLPNPSALPPIDLEPCGTGQASTGSRMANLRSMLASGIRNGAPTVATGLGYLGGAATIYGIADVTHQVATAAPGDAGQIAGRGYGGIAGGLAGGTGGVAVAAWLFPSLFSGPVGWGTLGVGLIFGGVGGYGGSNVGSVIGEAAATLPPEAYHQIMTHDLE